MTKPAQSLRPRDLRPPTPDADEQLMARFEQGETGALAELYRRHHGTALRVARRVLTRHEEAEEVVAQAFLRISGGAWRPTGPFRAFLMAVVRRASIDRLRRRSRHQRAVPALRERDPAYLCPEARAMRQSQLDAIRAAREQLPDALRQVLHQRFTLGWSIADVAQANGWTAQQARSRVSYACRRLRHVVEGAEHAEPPMS